MKIFSRLLLLVLALTFQQVCAINPLPLSALANKEVKEFFNENYKKIIKELYSHAEYMLFPRLFKRLNELMTEALVAKVETFCLNQELGLVINDFDKIYISEKAELFLKEECDRLSREESDRISKEDSDRLSKVKHLLDPENAARVARLVRQSELTIVEQKAQCVIL